jgi:hypothetical protein
MLGRADDMYLVEDVKSKDVPMLDVDRDDIFGIGQGRAWVG